MNKSTLTKLEYYKIIEKLKQKCGSQLGKDLAEKLYPIKDLIEISKMQKETSEAVLIKRYDGSMPLAGIIDTFDSLGLAEKGGILNPEEIGKVRENLYAAKNTVLFLNRKLPYEIPLLREKGERIVPLKELEKEIDGIIDEENQIKDSASDVLWNIRRKKKEC